MTSTSSILQAFSQGQLSAAIEQATSLLKHAPQEHSLRSLLVQLLCFAQAWQRADQHLETYQRLCPEESKKKHTLGGN